MIYFILQKPVIGSIITWSSFVTMVLSLLQVLTPLIGCIGAVLWAGVAWHKYQQQRNERKMSALQLKKLQDS